MGTVAHQPAALHHKNALILLGEAQIVGNENSGFSREHHVHGILNFCRHLHIQRRGWLIHQDNITAPQQLMGNVLSCLSLFLLIGIGLNQGQMVDPIRQEAGKASNFIIDLCRADLHFSAHNKGIEIFQRQHGKAGNRQNPVVLIDPHQRNHQESG